MGKLDICTKQCLVTGAAGGIGAATALALARAGARLVLTDLDPAGLERTVAQVRASRGQGVFSRAVDLT
ncbi:MAG: SDR family NAD(P)-dependent oxidoreductase, partial [Aeromicrobium sp.]